MGLGVSVLAPGVVLCVCVLDGVLVGVAVSAVEGLLAVSEDIVLAGVPVWTFDELLPVAPGVFEVFD